MNNAIDPTDLPDGYVFQTYDAAERLLGLRESTIRNWVRQGRLVPSRPRASSKTPWSRPGQPVAMGEIRRLVAAHRPLGPRRPRVEGP